MRSVRNGASKRLVDLSINVRNAKAALQERLDLAQRLLQLAEKARQLETDKEKVQPYYRSSLAADGSGASEEDAKQVRTLVGRGGGTTRCLRGLSSRCVMPDAVHALTRWRCVFTRRLQAEAEGKAANTKWMKQLLSNGGFSEAATKAIMDVGDPSMLAQLDNFYKK